MAPGFGRKRVLRVKTKWPLRPRGSTLRLLLAGRRAESNIAPIMTAIEMNPRHGFISAVSRGSGGRSERSDRQNSPAGGRNLISYQFCSGVKNLNAFKFRDLIQTGYRSAGFVFAGITSRSENDGDGSAFVPLDRVID